MTKGERIKFIREHIGKSQTEFADMIGVSKQTLYKYENGIVTNVPSDKIEAMADATGCSPEYIMGWSAEYKRTDFKPIENADALDVAILEAFHAASNEKKDIILDILKIKRGD